MNLTKDSKASHSLTQAPFLFLLIPLLGGILIQYCFGCDSWVVPILLTGIILLSISFFIPHNRQYAWRWLFGAGVVLTTVSFGIERTTLRQQSVSFHFDDKARTYKAVVMDIPQEKPNSLAYKVRLPDTEKMLMCYFNAGDTQSRLLSPGDELLIYTRVVPFRNMGNPGEFDYVQYMHDQGFAGSAYIQPYAWQKTGQSVCTLKILALGCRQQILGYYRSLGFSDDEFAILAALTLGYQAVLPDDVLQAFRTTGTVHVLSVSGLHVGIIYAMIAFALSFVHRSSKYYKLKPLLTILILWIYAYITGLPPSVVRASIMLSFFCAGQLADRKSYSTNALYISAFFMLLYNPMQLFDIGFQLSFLSVLSILYLHPVVSRLVVIKKYYPRKAWQLFTLSLVAQLATFPLCLYYFGTFPSYFFATNLVVVPLVSLITYSFGAILAVALPSVLFPSVGTFLYYLPVLLVKTLIGLLKTSLFFFESLPYALIGDVRFATADLIMTYLVVISVALFFIRRRPLFIQLALVAVALLFVIQIHNNVTEIPDQMVVYNRPKKTEITLGNIRFYQTLTEKDIEHNRYLTLGKSNMLIISSDTWLGKVSNEKFDAEYLLLTGGGEYSLLSLTNIVSPSFVILDGALPYDARRRLSKECQKLNIPSHDVSEKGAYRIFF